MKRLTPTFLLALLAVFMALPSCAAVTPYVVPVVTCSTETISPQDVKDAIGDLFAGNWADLERLGKKDGMADLACILDQAVTANPSLKAKAGEFKSLHAAEFRAAGVSASIPHAMPPVALEAPINGHVSTIEAVALAPVSTMVIKLPDGCRTTCGTEDWIQTQSRCLCWLGKGKRGHWVDAGAGG